MTNVNNGLLLDVAIANPCAPSNLDASVDVAGSALAKAIARRHGHYRGTFYDMYKLVPLAFSTSGDHCVDMHRLLRCLAKRRIQSFRVTFSAAEEAGLIARETGALRRELSITLQDALSLRTRSRLEKQALSRPSQGPPHRPPATSSTHPPGGPGTSATGTDARSRGAGVLGRASGVDIRVGGNGSSTGQRVGNRVGGNGGSDHRGDES